MTVVHCGRAHVEETIRHIHVGRAAGIEAIVFWLAARDGEIATVQHVYRPDQEALRDWFRIPVDSMHALHEFLRSHRWFIAAQVHSHPRDAFHSSADDVGAVVRHVGALSLVVPWFGARTTPATFAVDTKIYQLDDRNVWRDQSGPNSKQCVILI